MPLFPNVNVKQLKLNNEVTSVPDNLTSSLLPLGFKNGSLGFFNPLKSKFLKIIPHAHSGPVTTLSILSDGSVLSGSSNGEFKQWEYGKCINTFVFEKPDESFIWEVLSSPSAAFVIHQSTEGVQISQLNLTDKIWKPIYKFSNSLFIDATILNGTNKKLIFHDKDEVILFNTKSGDLEIESKHLKMPSEWPSHNSKSAFHSRYIFSADSNQKIVAVGNSRGQLRLLDTEQDQWKTFSDDYSESYDLKQLTFFSNNVLISLSRLSISTMVPMEDTPETLIQLWDINTNTRIKTLESSEPIDHLRVLPNGMLLTTISDKCNIQFWDVSHLKLECQETTIFSQTNGFST